MMQRIQGVPPRPPAYLQLPHAFTTRIPNRGWPDALVYADTGGLYAIAARLTVLNRTLDHYQGRIFAVPTVFAEVRRRAEPGGAANTDGLLHNAARVVNTRLLATGLV